ncbi:MAG: tetratricopeptide repeat protein [Flavobacteriaceae bacterium]
MKKRIILIICLWMIANLGAQNSQNPQREFAQLKQSGQLLEQVRFLTEHQDFETEQEELAYVYLSLGNYKLAQENLLKYIAKDSANIKAHLSLATCYKMRSYTKKAYFTYVDVHQLDSTNVEALVNLGRLSTKLKAKGSVGYYKQLIALNPDNPKWYEALGDKYNLSHNLNEAHSYYLKAYRLDEESLTYIFRMAQSHKKLREADSSRYYINKGLGVDPGNSAFTKLLMSNMYKNKEYDSLLILAEKRIEADRRDFTAYQYAGLAAMKLEQWDISEKYLRVAWIIDREAIAAYYMGLMYEAKKDYKMALSYFQISIDEVNRDNDDEYYHMAEIYYKMDQGHKAYEYYKKAYQANGGSSKALYNLIILSDKIETDKQIVYNYLERYNGRFESRDEKKTAYVQARMKEIEKEYFMRGESLN